jgi:hypothetical protein
MLADLEADRLADTAVLQQRLQQDCQAMRAAVSELRLDISEELQQIQRRVKVIKRQTAVDQAGYRQEQAMRRSELLPELADYVADLQVQVKASLEEMSTGAGRNRCPTATATPARPPGANGRSRSTL